MKYTLTIILTFAFLNSFSQNRCDWSTIDDANKNYKIGNFSEVIKTLKDCEINFTENQRLQAYRLLAKTHLAIDKDSVATNYIDDILEINSKFQPDYLADPLRFINLLEKQKKAKNVNMVTSVSKKAENVNEASATAVLITGEQIKRRGLNDYEAMLHDLPGFDISRSNGNLYSHVYQRGYRSINTNRTLFLIDGVEDNDLWSSNVYLSRQFSMSNIKNVEVIYGPASTMYGSNAFLGVVNIITKDPQDLIKPGKQIGVNAIGGYGSYNTKFVDATIAARTKNNNISFSVTGRVFYSDEQDLSDIPDYDYKPKELTDELATQYHAALDIADSDAVTDFLANNPTSGDYYNLNSDNQIILTDLGIKKALEYDNDVYNKVSFSDGTQALSLTTKFKFYNFLLGWSFWNKAEGPGAQYNDKMFMGYDQGQSWRPVHNYFYLKYDKDINSKLNISNFVRYKIHDFDKDNAIVRYRKYYLNGKYDLSRLISDAVPTWDSTYLFQKSSQIREEFKVLYNPIRQINLIAGFEARFSSIQGDYTLAKTNTVEETGVALTIIPGGNTFYSRDIGIYAQSDLAIINNLKITLGLRFDNNLIRENQGYGSVFNPRISAVYTPGTFIFKAIYATAFKDATNREKYSTAPGKRELSSPELMPEKVTNYEFVLGKVFMKNLNVNVSSYYSMYSNIIQEVQVTLDDGSVTNQNQAKGQAEIFGVNAFADYHFNNLSIYANYTYTEPYTLTENETGEIQKVRISDIASNSANFGINYLFKDMINFNLRTNFVGKKPTGENTTVPTNPETFDPYFILNGSITYTHKPTGLSIQLTGFNLLNTEYYSPGLDQAAGVLASKLIQNKRNIYLTLRFEF